MRHGVRRRDRAHALTRRQKRRRFQTERLGVNESKAAARTSGSPTSHALVQRGGDVRSVVMPRVTVHNIRKVLKEGVSPTATIMTDELNVYKGLERRYAGHETVKHSEKEYVRGAAHVNTIEGYFGLLKRGVMGTYHHWSRHHLHRYLSEFDFRYNARKVTDVQRAERAIGSARSSGPGQSRDRLAT